jgi:hypothetical protein
MKTFFSVFLFSFICLSFSTQAQLKRNSYIYQAAQVQLSYPEGWQMDEVDKVATLQNMEGDLSVSFSVMQASKMEEALMELETVMKTQLSNPEIISEPKIIEMNGMEGVVMEMQGMMKGMQVQLGVFIIDSPHNVLMVLGMGEKKSLTAYNKELDKIIKSIKPIN